MRFSRDLPQISVHRLSQSMQIDINNKPISDLRRLCDDLGLFSFIIYGRMIPTKSRESMRNIRAKITNGKGNRYSYYFGEGPLTQSNHISEKIGQSISRQMPIDTAFELPRTESERQVFPDHFKAYHQANRMQKFCSPNNLELDPRDEKVRIPFESSSYSMLLKDKFSTSMEPFEEELRDWLVDIIEIITSIGFNHLSKETLTEKETKNFVSKNILHNLKEMFQNYSEIPLEKRYNLIKFVNEESYQIFGHIAHKYPQTSSKGVSKRIKSKVQVIDNRESDEFDFLLRNNIHIQYRQDGDYSQDIMKVINKLISFSTEVFDQRMELEESNFEVFSQVMDFIFDASSNQAADCVASEVVKLLCDKKHKIDKDISYYKQCMMKNSMDPDLQAKSTSSKKISIGKQYQKQVLIGQKIPIGVPQFSDEDIEASKFKIHDSSILRLLTKWAEELRDKIINAEQSIYRRRFKFKNNRGRLITLEPVLKHKLYKAAIKEIGTIEECLKYLKEQNYYLETIFAEEENQGKYSKNDTKVGIFAAKLNEIASQYIFKYINHLIHSLLSIPLKAAEEVDSDREKAVLRSLDLVTFKIGDMMRCKCACSEQEFIKIMTVIDSLHLHSPDVLKIVRIKNRLETQNNDILINFLFGGKAECELQLSVLSPQRKDEKNSSKFSHLIYEIMRAELGPISQMASIVVQYDPLAYAYSKRDNYGPELMNKRDASERVSPSLKERSKFRSALSLKKTIEFPFVCCECGKLTIINNPDFYFKDKSEGIRHCNDCQFKYYKEENSYCSRIKKHILDSNFNEESDKVFCRNHLRFWDSEAFLSELQEQSDEKISAKWFPSRGFIIRLNQKKPKLELFTYMFEQTHSYVIFGNKSSEGLNLLSVFKIYQEKEKKIKQLRRQFKKFVLFEILDVIPYEQNGVKYFKCNREGCCGLKLNPGPSIERSEMQRQTNRQIVDKYLNQQKNLLYFNFMHKSFEVLQAKINKITEKNRIWKIRNTVQTIQAFSCQLQQIQIVNIFYRLSDLNIGQNPALTSLKGLENCLQLKYLDASDCDIRGIAELKHLRKLQTLNLTNNRRLDSIDSLTDHTELLDIFLRNTAVSCLAPLSECLKLESLDLQGCSHITSISGIKSSHLSYLSIINCYGIETFDLPTPATSSLKTIELYKNEKDLSVSLLLGEFGMNIAERQNGSKNNIQILGEEDIDRINKILKLRRTQSSPIE